MTKRRCSQRLKEQEHKKAQRTKTHVKREPPNYFFITDFHRCHLCHYRTNSSYFICRHYERHQHKNPTFSCMKDLPKYKCDKCDLNTDCSIELKNHQCYSFSKKTTKCYTCEKCDFRTHSRLVLLKHALFQCAEKHTKLIPRQKDYFKSYQFLLQIRHSNVEWLKCEQCSYMARLEGALGSHMVTDHSRQSNLRWYNCKLCLFNVEQIFYLRQHILIEHGGDEDGLSY
ncbi:hypothetical protein Zmor_022651 [Zophobas morio]|uniref:C2H2-type domain-containing protein n=1 Tax=Zophobas morio TaxID=2755281 RepID=A0AA38HWJ2_9CUCU|nr:hypothetical protein Zmor_022651 [Zophobas morio]